MKNYDISKNKIRILWENNRNIDNKLSDINNQIQNEQSKIVSYNNMVTYNFTKDLQIDSGYGNSLETLQFSDINWSVPTNLFNFKWVYQINSIPLKWIYTINYSVEKNLNAFDIKLPFNGDIASLFTEQVTDVKKIVLLSDDLYILYLTINYFLYGRFQNKNEFQARCLVNFKEPTFQE